MGKIGIFDSGFGGLSILKEIVKVLPSYDYIYLGDTARTPYGSHSQETIFEYTKQGVDFLFAHGAELIVLACNTASSEALRKIQQEYLPKYPGKKVLGVIIPACEDAFRRTKNKKIGVLGTEATVASHAFRRELQKLDPAIEVFEVAAPLLVPLVEAGEEESESARIFTKQYVDEILPKEIDTLILGCTHYGFFENMIKQQVSDVEIISEGKIVGEKLQEYLLKHSDIDEKLSRQSKLEFYTTDSVESFDRHGSRFFGREIKSERVSLS
ncbi:MAG: glutamate racemase [Candidatus Paceibacterota bacterium]|jgi:glutamate racemase